MTLQDALRAASSDDLRAELDRRIDDAKKETLKALLQSGVQQCDSTMDVRTIVGDLLVGLKNHNLRDHL